MTHISDFKLGRSIQGFYLCQEKHIRYAKNNNLYLDLVFSDATGIISGKMWDLVDEFQDRFEIGDPVAVKGKVSEYNDLLQLTVTQINCASNGQYGKYGYSPEKLIKKVDESIVDLWKNLMKISNKLKSPYKELVISIINKYRDKIQTIPVSVNHQHPVFGSFLEHKVTTSNISMEIISHYPSLDRDLVLTGILLYDIGKVKSINDDLIPGYTDEGKLIGNNVLSRDIVIDTARSMIEFPKDALIKLEHIILAHRGISNMQTITFPQFLEAFFVHNIIELDMKLNLMRNINENG